MREYERAVIASGDHCCRKEDGESKRALIRKTHMHTWLDRLTNTCKHTHTFTYIDIDGSLKSCSIKDCYRLGRYKVDQVKPRPILVKFVRIEDVSKVLANRWVAKSPILVKPDMTKEERVRESVLLKQRWSLICSGVPKRAIKVSRSKIFVNNVEYGTYSHAGFVHSTAYPVSSAPAPAKEIPSNHGPQTLSKTTASTTPLVSSVRARTSVSPPSVDDSTSHSTPHCLSPTSVSQPVPPSSEPSNSPSPKQ